MSKAFNIATNLGAYQSAFDSSGDLTAPNITTNSVTVDNISAANNVNVGNINVSSSNHTWTIKAEDAGYTGYPNSGQFSIYNGATKLWGITEGGWVQNPNVILFSSYGTSGGTSFNTTTVVPYNQIVDNVGGHYDPTTYTFTAPINGIYFFSASFLEYPSASTDFVTFWCSKNGTGYNSSYPMSRGILTSQQTLGWHGHVSLSAGDYIQAKIEGTGTYYTSDGHAHFSGHLIG